jgi:hypothetical protein
MTNGPTVEMHWEQERLIVVADGTTEPSWVLGLIDRIGEAAASHSTRSVLVDARRLRAVYADLDRYNMGVQMGRRWREIPYALVAAADMVDPRRFGEVVAQNRGVNGRVFIDLAEAERWLNDQHSRRS